MRVVLEMLQNPYDYNKSIFKVTDFETKLDAVQESELVDLIRKQHSSSVCNNDPPKQSTGM